MNNSEKFAVSLVSLALARNRYVTSKNVQLSHVACADILAVRGSDDTDDERFAVQVKALPDRDAVPRAIKVWGNIVSDLFGLTTYLAFFIENENILLVDDELRNRMRFTDEEVRLETIARRVLATPVNDPG
jgi:hypothetical protein